MKKRKNVHSYNFTELQEISKRKSNVQYSRIFFGGVGEKDPKIRNSVHPFEAVQ